MKEGLLQKLKGKAMQKIKVASTQKTRFSGVELLKVIAIFLICISHAVQTSEAFINQLPSFNGFIILLRIFRYFGHVGNIIFIISSCYFSFLSKSKTKFEKAINLLLDSCFISIILFAGIFGGGTSLSDLEIVMQFFPDIFFNVWFVPTYVIFYFVQPLLKKIAINLDKNQYTIFIFLLTLLYFVLTQLKGVTVGLSSIYGFVYIYFIVAFMERFCQNFMRSKKKNIFCFVFFLFIFLLFVIGKNFASIFYPPLGNSQIYQDLTVLFLFPTLFSVFNLFRMMKFYSKTINFCSSVSLFVYCIHENYLVRNVLRPLYYQETLAIRGDLYFLWVILLGITLFVLSYLLAIIYNFTFHKIANFMARKSGQAIEGLAKKMKKR